MMIGSTIALGETLEINPPSPDYHLPDNTDDLLRLDSEMLAFFSARIDRKAPLPTQLDELAQAILGEEGLQFRYEAEGVYEASEAFQRRRGNCLTYSMLTVAVAREFGIPARFNEVVNHPRWSRTGGIIMLCRHLNVRVDHGPNFYELDLQLNNDLLTGPRSGQVVSDARAFAAAYTSAGVHRLSAGDRAGALRLLEKATVIDPTEVTAWTNLGTALVQSGQFDQAWACFRRALAKKPHELSALSGLASIHRARGRRAEAEKLEQAVIRYRESNPYYLLSVALDEKARGNLEAARRHLKRAISIKKDEPEFHQAMAEVALVLGLKTKPPPGTKRSPTNES